MRLQFSILTRPEVRLQLVSLEVETVSTCVSILTRPEVRLQFSILTRPEVRLQSSKIQFRRNLRNWLSLSFQSSPGPKCGCNINLRINKLLILKSPPQYSICLPRRPCRFQSSPGPKCGCNACRRRGVHVKQSFQSSPGPKCGCNFGRVGAFGDHQVSILTRPEVRLQYQDIRRRSSARAQDVSILTRPEVRLQYIETGGFLRAVLVSILTRPEVRLQSLRVALQAGRNRFQSSPGPKCGCNLEASDGTASRCGFNPHPARSAVAMVVAFNLVPAMQVSILTRPEVRLQYTAWRADPRRSRFQSSPGPKCGCNGIDRRHSGINSFNPHPARSAVAIHSMPPNCASKCLVSILTRPEVRLQCAALIEPPTDEGFNPHPARSAVAIAISSHHCACVFQFQSSPGPKCGCNFCEFARSARVASFGGMFQSSPGPKCGCNSLFTFA